MIDNSIEDIPEIVRTSINLIYNTNGIKGKGLKRSWHKHGSKSRFEKTKFSITQEELLEILQDSKTIETPICRRSRDGGFIREIDFEREIGELEKKYGGEISTRLRIITDKDGNLVNTHPIR